MLWGREREREREIEAVTPQSYADATAKAAAMLPVYTDPPLVITRGPHILAAQQAPNTQANDRERAIIAQPTTAIDGHG